jgi:formylglycine-generating enzyme required for sulfatase activity
VFLSGVGKKRQGGLGDAINVVNALVPEGPGEVASVTETHWRAAALAGEALLDLDLAGETVGRPHYRALLKRVRRWLTELVKDGQLAARERAEAGDVLGRLGDHRPGVGTIIVESKDEPEVLPDIHWVEVSAGSFLMGSAESDEMAYDDEHPQHELHLPTFYIARYPITNAQYRSFVEDGSYDEPRYWTEEGWAWRTGEREPDLSVIDDEEWRRKYADWLAERPVERRDEPFWWNHPRWGLPNRPVVGVTWYESLAYCQWLREQLQAPGYTLQVWRNGRLETLNLEPETLTVQLPSEAEWEKAARGADGRRWPWGDEWLEGRANTEEANVEETSPVGAFPGGASPWGAMDMAGNVWEWTRTAWGHTDPWNRPDYSYPYDPSDGREDVSVADWLVMRGGSWNNNRRFARCACRTCDIPDLFDDGFGLRVVVSLVNSES